MLCSYPRWGGALGIGDPAVGGAPSLLRLSALKASSLDLYDEVAPRSCDAGAAAALELSPGSSRREGRLFFGGGVPASRSARRASSAAFQEGGRKVDTPSMVGR